MVLRTPGPVIRSGFPRAGSPVGDQKRDEFIAAMLAIMGDPRLLWLPKSADTTTSTDDSRYAATITWDATVAARKSTLGSGLAQTFDGTNDEGDIPDADRYSFGNGTVDQAFSIVALVDPGTLDAGSRVIASKYDLTTGSTKREWILDRQGTTQLNLWLYDESASASINQYNGTVFASNARVLAGASYDGSGGAAGIRLYQNGLTVTGSIQTSGTYVAMENTASLVRIGFQQGAAAGANFWRADIALLAIAAKALSEEDMWNIKGAVNAMFDLAL